ncbi:hypothetical protein MtrunA17_Chr2g0309921 [Medicago truncatula]|uniref:Transmembrane protein n=1 Tax=Medicago truncatula TaxID=3880 RepID=A0A396JDL7_MEDTR|nr:hypothetical protein MtrunA17_Chr2g0309921 [Medicago truncatula]
MLSYQFYCCAVAWLWVSGILFSFLCFCFTVYDQMLVVLGMCLMLWFSFNNLKGYVSSPERIVWLILCVGLIPRSEFIREVVATWISILCWRSIYSPTLNPKLSYRCSLFTIFMQSAFESIRGFSGLHL